jgi:hypothetical protein
MNESPPGIIDRCIAAVSTLDSDLLRRLETLWGELDPEVVAEVESQVLRSVGFHEFFESADVLLREIVDRLEARL